MIWSSFRKRQTIISRGSRYVLMIYLGPTCANDIKLHRYYLDLRPEEATKEDHPNQYIYELRKGL